MASKASDNSSEPAIDEAIGDIQGMSAWHTFFEIRERKYACQRVPSPSIVEHLQHSLPHRQLCSTLHTNSRGALKRVNFTSP